MMEPRKRAAMYGVKKTKRMGRDTPVSLVAAYHWPLEVLESAYVRCSRHTRYLRPPPSHHDMICRALSAFWIHKGIPIRYLWPMQ